MHTQVVPTESGIKHTVHSQRCWPGTTSCLSIITSRTGPYHYGVRAKALHGPGHDQVCLANEVVQVGIGDTIRLKVPPECRNTEHHRAAAINRVVLQEIDQPLQTDVADVIKVCQESQLPKLPPVVFPGEQIRFFPFLIGNLQFIHQVFPIVDDRRAIFTARFNPERSYMTAMALLYLEAASMAFCKITADSFFRLPSRVASKKTLHKDSIHVVFLHPFKMKINGAFIQ